MADPLLEDIISRMVRNEADMAYRRRVRTVFEWIEPTDADLILDGGCGRGFYLKYIRVLCSASLIGVEVEQDVARLARAALANDARLAVLNANLYDLPFAPSIFDKAVLSEVLEHVDDDVRALKSVLRALKPGGLIAITVPNANYPFWWDPINKVLELLFKTHVRRGIFAGIWANHVRLYSQNDLRTAVQSAGLEIVEERSFTHSCFPFIHNLVYGFGKTLLEARLLPSALATAADRYNVTGKRGSLFNLVNLGLEMFEWFDRPNRMNEPPGRSTVNLCVLARKPL